MALTTNQNPADTKTTTADVVKQAKATQQPKPAAATQDSATATRIRPDRTPEQIEAAKAARDAKVKAQRDQETAFAQIGVASANGHIAGLVTGYDERKAPTILLRTTHATLARLPIGTVVALVPVADPFAKPAEVAPQPAAAVTSEVKGAGDAE